MSHYLTIDTDYLGEMRLALTCTATPDAPCRMRPSDGRESWHHGDQDLTPGHDCWAVEWASEGGWETVASADDAQWPRIPVTVEYDEGVIVAPVYGVRFADGDIEWCADRDDAIDLMADEPGAQIVTVTGRVRSE